MYILRGRRALLAALLHSGTATADDVRAAVELPADLDPKLFGVVPGALARLGIIKADGFIKSGRPQSHARPVQRWRLADPAGAREWLWNHPDRPDPMPPDDCDGFVFSLDPKQSNPAVTAAGLV